MIEPDVPVAPAWAAVSVVLWASYNVTEAVPTPAEKLTEAGYAGAVPPGLHTKRERDGLVHSANPARESVQS